MNEIQAGSVVCLKSEKHLTSKIWMTVTFVGTTGKATCLWFVNGELKEADIVVEALYKAKES